MRAIGVATDSSMSNPILISMAGRLGVRGQSKHYRCRLCRAIVSMRRARRSDARSSRRRPSRGHVGAVLPQATLTDPTWGASSHYGRMAPPRLSWGARPVSTGPRLPASLRNPMTAQNNKAAAGRRPRSPAMAARRSRSSSAAPPPRLRPRLTTNQGPQVADDHNSLKAGVRGPSPCSKTSSSARRSRTLTTSAFPSASCMPGARQHTGSSRCSSRCR